MIPKGWRLVPEGTTWDMRNQCRELLIDYCVKHDRLDALAVAIWQTMMDAAPPYVETLTTNNGEGGGNG